MIIPMGDDFHYMNANGYFNSLDNMINYWNENMMEQTNIEFIYSTPSMYIDAIAAEKITWPTKYDDIFPYADDD
jgi:lysosomal alpha-mannosidase